MNCCERSFFTTCVKRHVVFRIYDVPVAILDTAWAFDQHAMMQDCGGSAREFGKYTMENDLDEFFFFPHTGDIATIGQEIEDDDKDYVRLKWRNLYRRQHMSYNLKMALCGEGQNQASPRRPSYHVVFPSSTVALQYPRGSGKCNLPEPLQEQAAAISQKEPPFFAHFIGLDRGFQGGKWVGITANGVYHSMHHLIAATNYSVVEKSLNYGKPQFVSPFHPARVSRKYEGAETTSFVLHYRDSIRKLYMWNETRLPVHTFLPQSHLASAFIPIFRSVWREILGIPQAQGHPPK